MTKQKTYKIFPVPIFEYKVENYNELNIQLEKYIYDLRKKDKKGLRISNDGGWHSPYFNIKENDLLKKFLDTIHKYLFEIITKEFGWKYALEKIQIEGMWSIINPKNSFNIRHNHTNSTLSAAYYVKAKKNCGKISFFDPKEQRIIKTPLVEKNTELSAQVVNIDPEEGHLLLFPSYLYHAVAQNLSDEDRIVISFNVDFEK